MDTKEYIYHYDAAALALHIYRKSCEAPIMKFEMFIYTNRSYAQWTSIFTLELLTHSVRL